MKIEKLRRAETEKRGTVNQYRQQCWKNRVPTSYIHIISVSQFLASSRAVAGALWRRSPKRFGVGTPFSVSPLLRFSLFMITCSFQLISCKNSLDEVTYYSKQDTTVAEAARTIELTYSDSAIVRFKINSTRMEYHPGENSNTEFFDGVKVFFYRPTGGHQQGDTSNMEAESQITAKYAIQYEKEDRIEAKYDVVVVNREGDMLNTEYLIWEKSKQLIHTDSFVKITTKDEIMFGDGLEANEDFSKYKIKNIKGIIQQKE